MAVGVSESTLVLAAAVATVVKAFLRKENEVTDEFPLSEVSVSHTQEISVSQVRYVVRKRENTLRCIQSAVLFYQR